MSINNIEVIDAEIIKIKKPHWTWLAIKSRFLKGGEPWVKERREKCKNCVYNSKNFKEKKTIKQKTLKLFSDLLSLVTLSFHKDLGQCLHIDCGCSITHKTLLPSEETDCPEGKWSSIYIPNSSQTKNGIK